MKPQVTDETLEMVTHFEGTKLRAYLDPIKKPTIGTGHTRLVTARHVREGVEITEAFALELLRWDIIEAEWRVQDAVKAPLTDHQYGAIVSLAFNLTWRSWSKASLVRVLNEGDYEEAARRFTLYVKGGRPLRTLNGLVRRRKAEERMFRGEDWRHE